jgi:hypothetical protein
VAPCAAPEVASAGRAKTLVGGGVRTACGRVSRRVCSHSQPVFISTGERHGIIQHGWLLEFNVRFQRIAEVGRENINLLLLREAGAAVDKRQKPTLIIGDCCLPPKLDQLAQRVAAEGWPKSLINQLDEGRPIWRPMVALDKGVPLNVFKSSD